MAATNSLRALLIVFAMVVFILADAAQAVLTLEYDFRINQNASFAQPGIPSGGVLGGAASVTTTTAIGPSNNPGYVVAPELQNGYMTISNRGTSSPHVTGDYMTTAAPYSLIFNSTFNNFGSGTFVTVVRPNFNSPAARQWFMTHSAAGGAKNIGVVSEGAMRVGGGRGGENAFGLANPTVGNFPWQNGDWFMVASSWQQSSGADGTMPTCCGDAGLPDGKLRTYVRQLTSGGQITPNSAAFFTSDDAVRLWHTRFATDSLNDIITLGNRRGFGGGELSEGGTGDYALFQFYDNMFNKQDFDSLFNQFLAPIPEPSSMSLSLLGCLALVRTNRRKRLAARHSVR